MKKILLFLALISGAIGIGKTVPATTTVSWLGNANSLTFDGATSFVWINTNSNLNPDFNTAWWTSFWFKTSQATTTPTLISNLNAAGNRGIYIYMRTAGGFATFEYTLFNDGSHKSDVSTTCGGIFNDGNWHNMIINNSGNHLASGWSVYIDGAACSMTTVADTLGSNTTTTTTKFTIGADVVGTASGEDFFNGKITQFTFTQGSTVNSTQASQIYNRSVSGNLTPYRPAIWQYLSGPGDATGAGGLKNHGSATGTTFSTTGMTGSNVSTDVPSFVFNRQSLVGNGSTTVLGCGANASTQPTKTTAFSVFGWVYVGTASISSDISFWGNSPANGWGGWNQVVNHSPSGQIELELDGDSPKEYIGQRGASGNLTFQAWHQLGFTYDGSNSNTGIIVYLDGAVLSTTPYGDCQVSCGGRSSLNGTLNGGSPFTIAAQGIGTTAQALNGKVDEVTYWNRVLTGSEVTTLYNSGHAGDASAYSFYGSACTSYWRMEPINLLDTTSSIGDRKGPNVCNSNTAVSFSLSVP